ncbi:hypothetical protein DTU20_19125 [Salmonella enterica subsp. enterica serovar Westhampton]|nr:hypothetical protein [Salmonella enterica subsp. enterica serovar Westhampton]
MTQSQAIVRISNKKMRSAYKKIQLIVHVLMSLDGGYFLKKYLHYHMKASQKGKIVYTHSWI